jgi:competence protein ComEC
MATKFRRFLLTDLLFLKVFFAFAIGILSVEYLQIQYAAVVPILISFIAIIGYKLLKIARSKWTDVLFFSLIILSGIIFHFYQIYQGSQANNRINSFTGLDAYHWVRIDDKPLQKANSQSINATLLSSKFTVKESKNLNQKIIIYIPKDIVIDSDYYGKILQIKGKLSYPNEAKYPFEFDYKTWLKRKGIYATIYSREIVVAGKDSSFIQSLKSFPLRIRDYYEREIEKYIHDENASDIAKSLLIGVRTDIDKELYNSYADTGTIHILSVSGLHFGILILFLDFLLSFFIKNEKLKIAIKQPLLLIYALMTGFSPPVMRSFLMFLFFDLEKITKAKTSSYNILFLSAWLILLFDSNQIFDVGFQLSYIAILGIMLFYNRILWKLQFNNRITNWIWQSTATMLAAWIVTMPLTVYYFNKISFIGMFTNYIVLPIVVVVMYLGFGLMLFSKIQFLGNLFGNLLSYLISLQNKIILFYSELPLASIYPLYIDFTSLILLIFGLVFLFLFLRLNDKYSLRCTILFLSLFILNLSFRNHTTIMSNNWYLIPSYKQTAFAYSTSNKLYIFADSIEPKTNDYFIEKLKIYEQIDSTKLYSLHSYFQNLKMKYSTNLNSKSTYYILSKENKNEWSLAIENRDSFILGGNLGYKKDEIIQELKSKNKYFVEN